MDCIVQAWIGTMSAKKAIPARALGPEEARYLSRQQRAHEPDKPYQSERSEDQNRERSGEALLVLRGT